MPRVVVMLMALLSGKSSGSFFSGDPEMGGEN